MSADAVKLPCIDCGRLFPAGPDALVAHDKDGIPASWRSWCDRELAKRGEPPLRDDEVLKCHGDYLVQRERVNEGRAADYANARALFDEIIAGRGVPAYRVDVQLATEYGEMIRNGLAIAAERARKPKGKAAQQPEPYRGGGFADQ